jgi:hypothetical protein
VRSTNSWIIKVFSALATVLIGSGPLLVKLGSLPSWPRATVAALAGGLALLGVGVVIDAAARVMLPQAVDLVDLATGTSNDAVTAFRTEVESTEAKRQLYLGANVATIQELVAQMEEWRRTLDQLFAEATPGTADDELAADIKAAESQLAALEARGSELLEHALYLEIRASFDRALKTMFGAAAAVAAGTAVYLGALGIDMSKAKEASPPVATAPTKAGTLIWNTTDSPGARSVAAVRKDLGLLEAGCNAMPVLATGAGTRADPLAVTTLGLDGCPTQVISFTIDDRYAQLKVPPIAKYSLENPRTTHDRTPAVSLGVILLVAGLIIGLAVSRLRRARTTN